jgi:hypothetical protein
MVNVCDHLKMDRATADAAMAEVVASGFALYDPRAEVVFVCKALKYQAPKGTKSIPGAVNALDQIKGSPRLFWAFLGAAEHYAPDFAAAVRSRYGIDSDWRNGSPIEGASMDHRRGIDGAYADEPPLALAPTPSPRELPAESSTSAVDIEGDELAELCHLHARLVLERDPSRSVAPDGHVWRDACSSLLETYTPAELAERIRACAGEARSMPELRVWLESNS